MSLKTANKVETNVYSVEVEISAEQLKEATVKAYNQNKKKIALPGFRKGKAPKAMIEKMYGKNFFYEDALDILYPEVVSAAIEEAKLEIVAAPYDVEITKLDEDGAALTLKVIVKPEVELGTYKGLKAEKESTDVTDEEVDAEIKNLLERNSRLITVEDRAVEKGDIANINFEGFTDGVAFDGGKGEDFDLEIGSGQFIPGFEDQIIGHSAGEEFDVNVTFPTEYAPELAGKDATFKVKVNEIKSKEYPELDDEFAKDVSEFDTLDELKADIKAKIGESKEQRAKDAFESALLKQICEGTTVEIPQVMIDDKANELKQQTEQQMAQSGLSLEMYLQYMGLPMEKYMEDLKAQAEIQVKTRLALEKIVEVENIEATDEDVDAEFAKYAEMYKMDVETLKKFINPAEVKKDLAIGKAVDFIVENAKVGKPAAKKAAKKAAAADGEEKPAKKPAAKKTTKKAADGEEKPAKKPAAKKTTKKKEEDAE